MRAGRLLSILLTLQTRGRVTAEALAAEFEVSVRTIYRDMDELTLIGAPIYADRGRDGGFALLDGWRTRLTGLTDGEAETLFLGGLAGPAAQMGFSQAVSTMQLKLLAALPPDRQAAAEKLHGRFHLDPVGWYQDADAASHLPALAQAIWRERRIALRYESWKGEVDRVLNPLGLILKGGLWYLAARPGEGGRREARIYRVSNVRALAVHDEGFERPAGFDLAAWWTEASRRFETERFTGEARLRLTAEGRKRLAALGVEYARRVAAAPADAADLTVPIESVDHAAWNFLRLGDQAEVLDPPELRRMLAQRIGRMAASYR